MSPVDPYTADESASKRLRVLMSAYACEPGKGSEPAVGWNVAVEVAKHHEVWVLTRSNNRGPIEEQLASDPIDGLHFVYHDLPKWARWWKKGGRGVQLYYYLWQVSAIRKVRKLNTEIGFDISHHVTFVKYWAPSCLAWLDVPFVWGPVGGGDSTPFGFLRGGGVSGWLHEIIRDVLRRLSHLDPLIRYTSRRCARCIPVTNKTEAAVRSLSSHIQTRLMTQVGMSREALKHADHIVEGARHERTHDFLFVGNLIFLKGVHLALKAFAKAAIDDSRFVLVGDGCEMNRLKALAMDLGIQDRVVFRGRMPLDQVMCAMADTAALVHLSLHDSGGFVPLEAMACRKPVICLDLAGPAVLVSGDCGVRISAESPGQVVTDTAAAMKRIVSDTAVQEEMGRAGRARVEREFLWEEKAIRFVRIYEDLLGKGA